MSKITTIGQTCQIISSNYLLFVCKTEQYKHNQKALQKYLFQCGKNEV